MADETNAPILTGGDPLPDQNAPEGTIPQTQDADGTALINEAGYTDVDGVEEGDALAAQDVASPQVHTLTVAQQPNKTTILSARVFGPQGWQNKNAVLPALPTAKQIADLVGNIASW